MNQRILANQTELFNDEVRQICASLIENSKLNGFSYQRFYADGRLLLMTTTDNNFNLPYITNNLYPTYAEAMNCPVPYAILSCSSELNAPISYNKMWHENILLARQNNIEHRFFLIEKLQNYYEVFCFTASDELSSASNLFLGNLDVLTKFAQYFKHSAADLIKKKCQQPILLDSNYYCDPNPTLQTGDSLKRDTILNSIDVISTNTLSKALSPREIQCLELVATGYSAKEIAKQLNLSPRTVESYIAKMKIKFNFSTRAQLRQLWQESLT